MWWITIKSREYKRQARFCWSRWYAWYPVTVNVLPDGANKKIWLDVVERKLEKQEFPFSPEWIYREILDAR